MGRINDPIHQEQIESRLLEHLDILFEAGGFTPLNK
jgi:hypothetical protein